ncbi:MAG TPA: efflux RND transporter periplasmic adaptor subunit [Firmicutes bacterium]|nr:efflux RND transporter periplasmic adaptor subunit [Bacillota bacterium]
MRVKRLGALCLGLFFVVAMLAVPGCGGEQGPAAETAIPVAVYAVQRGHLNTTVTVTGKVEGLREVNLVPNVAGEVTAVYVETGASVQAGQPLVQIDQSDYAARVSQAEAALQMAQAGYVQAEAGYLNAKANYERMQGLFAEGAVSRQQFEAAELQYRTAQAQFEKGSAAQVQQAQANLALARSALADTTITAPFAGVVGVRLIDPGQMAAPGNPVMSVLQIDKVRLRASLTENEVNAVRVGDKVQVQVAAVSGEPFAATVKSVGLASAATQGTYPVEVEIDNQDGLLKPGMIARLTLSTEQRENVLLLPQRAVLKQNGEQAVFVIKGERAELRVIETGLSDNNLVEVRTGLQEGELVVTAGQHYLQDGSQVQISEGGVESQ